VPYRGPYNQPRCTARAPASNRLRAPSRLISDDIVRRTVRSDTPSRRAAVSSVTPSSSSRSSVRST